jgi:hypothetical protein
MKHFFIIIPEQFEHCIPTPLPFTSPRKVIIFLSRIILLHSITTELIEQLITLEFSAPLLNIIPPICASNGLTPFSRF